MTSPAQQLRDAVAKTVAIGAAVAKEAETLKAEASGAAQPNPVTIGGGDERPDSAGA